MAIKKTKIKYLIESFNGDNWICATQTSLREAKYYVSHLKRLGDTEITIYKIEGLVE